MGSIKADFKIAQNRVKLTKAAAAREEIYEFAHGCIERGEPECGAAAVICFGCLQQPENVIARHIKWSGYRTGASALFGLSTHKTGVTLNHPLEEKLDDGSVVKFNADARQYSRISRDAGYP